MEAWIVVGQAVALTVGVPAFLLAFFAGLGRLEEWMLRADERAETVARLLEQLERADDVEIAVAQLMAPVDPPDGRRGGRRGSSTAAAAGEEDEVAASSYAPTHSS